MLLEKVVHMEMGRSWYLQKQPDNSLYKLKIVPAGNLMNKIIQKQFNGNKLGSFISFFHIIIIYNLEHSEFHIQVWRG